MHLNRSSASLPYRVLIVASAVVSGLLAGFFYAYSSSVMIGLADTNDPTFIEAMQQINANVRNIWFGPVYFGSVAIPAVAVAIAARRRDRLALPWLTLALAFAIIAFGITAGVSVPLNNDLAEAGSVELMTDPGAVRNAYEAPWVRWNVARTVASTLALVTGCIAISRISTGTPNRYGI